MRKMIKSIISTAVALLLLLSANFFEQVTLKNSFSQFYEIIEETQNKLKSTTPSLNDSEGLEDFWLDKKRSLHIWIPHSEIKEIDLWVSECSAYTKIGKFDEAITKLEVLKTLASQIPNNFCLHLENLF